MTFYNAMPSDTTFDPKDQSTWQVTDWTRGLHKAAAVKPSDPNFASAHAFVQKALSHISDLHALENHADKIATEDPGAGWTFAQNLTNEAGLGIPAMISESVRQTQAQGQAANPTAAALGTGVGMAGMTLLGAGAGEQAASGLAKGLSPLLRYGAKTAGAALGAGAAAGTRGAMADPEMTLGAKRRLLAGGVIGEHAAGMVGTATAIFGGLGLGYGAVKGLLSKGAGEGSPLAAKIADLLEGQLGRKPTATELREGVRAAATQELAKLGVSTGDASKVLDDALPSVKAPTATTPAPGSPGLAANTSTPLTEGAAKMSDAELSAQPLGATPPVEASGAAPGVVEGQASKAASMALGKGAPEAAPQPGLASRVGASATQTTPTSPGDHLRDLEKSIGRALTPEEREMALKKLYGRLGQRPGHPYWRGGGSPTP